MSSGKTGWGYSWFDLLLYGLTVILLIPIVMKFVDTLLDALSENRCQL